MVYEVLGMFFNNSWTRFMNTLWMIHEPFHIHEIFFNHSWTCMMNCSWTMVHEPVMWTFQECSWTVHQVMNFISPGWFPLYSWSRRLSGLLNYLNSNSTVNEHFMNSSSSHEFHFTGDSSLSIYNILHNLCT